MKTSMYLTTLAAAAVSAQRPADMSICDFYTTGLLKQNTAANQEKLLTLVVNTAVIGNYTQPNVGVMVPGILTPGEFMGTQVNLLKYFDGMLDSTNFGGSAGQSVNFLDGGGAAPLKMNMAANSQSSKQFTLLTHLYQYFGGLLGCSMFSNTTMPYAGSTSMYNVHKFMALDDAEVNYFITQVGLSAASFGVAKADVAAVGKALTDAFGMRCAPPAAIPPTASPALQAICIASDCPQAPMPDCSAYSAVVEPMTVSSAAATGSMPASASGSMPASASAPAPTGSSSSVPPSSAGVSTLPVVSFLAASILGLAAFLL